jgi:hypothetical protein
MLVQGAGPLVLPVEKCETPRNRVFEPHHDFTDVAALLEPDFSGRAVGQGKRNDVESLYGSISSSKG